MILNGTLKKAADTVRLLSADGVQAADSGHPGLPMGCADYAIALWHKHLRHDPTDPNWLGRDRFVLSAGHGSMLIYSLLHLYGYDMALEDLAQFRQWGSKTPGHPEYGYTPGVEVTAGPLSTGLSSAVGMAIAAKKLATDMANEDLFNQRIFVISSDGEMMEGASHEACALAGHLNLDNLIVFYDDNQITIEGSTSLAFSENVQQRYEAYGWHVLRVDGHDLEAIDAAIEEAKNVEQKPVLIIGRTTIGYGSPNKAGTSDVHGAPLGKEELAATKQQLGFPPDKDFFVPDAVRELCDQRIAELRQKANEWNRQLEQFLNKNAEKAGLLQKLQKCRVPENILDELLAAVPEKNMATRVSGGEIMQRVAALVPSLCGGAADLNPSTKTYLKKLPDFTAENSAGRNIHYGVRELGMGLCSNGLALYGTAIPFTATFTVFADFMKPALRLAAIQKLHEVFIFTHDSIFVGEDGPTHQPIEQLSMLRSIPGMTVMRPAESYEVAHAWATALQLNGPVSLFLTRQTVENLPEALRPKIQLSKGAYVLSDDEDFEILLIATGSEVMPAYYAAEQLRGEGLKIRLVSMPSWELFEKQDGAYKESILPSTCQKRVSIEAASTFGWEKYVGCNGLKIGVDHFGHSAPYEFLAEKYGLIPAALAARIKKHFDLV